MYIRRKVYSVALDENGEERYFSTNEIVNEEDYLQEMMYADAPAAEAAEKAPGLFKRGLEGVKGFYMKDGKLRKGRVAGTAVAAAAIPGTIYGIKALKRRKARKAAEEAAAAELAEANYSDYYENLYSDDEVPSEEEMVVVPKKAVNKKRLAAIVGAGTAGTAGAAYLTGKGIQKWGKGGKVANALGNKWVGRGALAAGGLTAAGVGAHYGKKAWDKRKARKAAEAALAAEEAGEE